MKEPKNAKSKLWWSSAAVACVADRREEEGLLGSKEYIKAHYGDPATMQLKPEHAKFAGYFNVDNGTGLIRGVYQQGNEAVARADHTSTSASGRSPTRR